jgi:anti-sigma-K factor RskA
MTDEDDILAAEYALGLLSPDEAAAAEARLQLDGPLSLRVAWWRDQLGTLAHENAVEPASHVWPAIAARLGSNDNSTDAARPWKWATGGLGALAAVLLVMLAMQPTTLPPVRFEDPNPLVASVTGEAGTTVTVSFDQANRRMLITPVALDPGKGDAELWVIPAGATAPVSLGVIDAKQPASHSMDPAKSGMMLPGATFAISREAKGGSSTGAPQGPVIATGKIIRV